MSACSQTRPRRGPRKTGRPDQPSHSMRLHRMWPAQVGFICHACVPSQERHRIISSINRCWWFIGLVLNKHGNDPLTSYTETRSSRGFISHSRLWSGLVVIFHFCLFGTLVSVCVCVRSACLQRARAKKSVFMCVAGLLIALMLRTQHIVDKILIGFNTIIT